MSGCAPDRRSALDSRIESRNRRFSIKRGTVRRPDGESNDSDRVVFDGVVVRGVVDGSVVVLRVEFVREVGRCIKIVHVDHPVANGHEVARFDGREELPVERDALVLV